MLTEATPIAGMARILILYASLGSGHIYAAQALREAFGRYPNVEVRVEDALAYASPILRETLTRAYEQLSEKAPRLYRLIYEGSDTSDLRESMSNTLLLSKIERPFFRKFEQLIKEESPDVFICVQQIPSRLLQLVQKEYGLRQPHYVVITDMVAHSTWINYDVDGYFLAGDLTAELLIKDGIDPLLLHITGIPIKLEICEPKPMQQMRLKHNLPIEQPLVALFGGGLQPQRVRTIVRRLLESPLRGTLVVVAGRNHALEAALANLEDGPQMHLYSLGRIDFVDDLIAASDVVVTKAGGLIASEVIARGTPLVIIDPIPGQEEWNADAIAAYGVGIQLRLLEMVAPTVQFLMEQPEHLAFMRERAKVFGRPRAALTIAERILAMLDIRLEAQVLDAQ
ncbi:MGDG synthase family glycosyltransferase [Gloeobacter kilaueensis]|uniref:Monogalactosyldiacylglycerol synthase n=1 Tax=Gloeobacter kilaueensis (strain ATCC BAA-2537 / CCAP 1431/1 / ULC 316 / JS1) TaxID=1183438 RepID=U5QKG5_GLOK1|nr:monogalactosyldiacylglycerol synthase [Gloeobacter kilaueensis]AGY58185.1 monogalactosyldiacylglycerol synthase [Gloeobacter kilaueensis JS1]